VDATGYTDGTADGFWIYWDGLTEQYGVCPPPGRWVASGRCIRHSDKCQLVAGSAAALVANALTYVANFTGVGTYAVFDSSLGVIFGISATGYMFMALCDPPPRCAL